MLKSCLGMLLISILLCGCAVLTPSQVREAKSFSTAAAALAGMPGHVIEEHGELRATVKTASASESTNGERAWNTMRRGMEIEDALKEKAERVDKACRILKQYGELLVLLSSDKPIEDLQAAADTIGGKLDSSIDSFNEAYDTNISTIGGEVAGVVRGIGGLYIRRKQTQALREAIVKGDSIVSEMSAEIQNLLKEYIRDEEGLSLIPSEREDLVSWYKAVGYKQDFPSSQLVQLEIRKSEAVEAYATKALQASEKMSAAHAKLLEKLSSKRDLKDAIELVTVYVDEVKEAQDLYDKFSD